VSENEIEFVSRMLILPGLLIAGGFAVLVATIVRGGKVAELRHRERMAMIERGMTPPEPVAGDGGMQRASGFKTTLGIVLSGLGLALFMLIAFAAGDVGVATGVGGAFVALGLAFVAAAFNTKRETPPGGLPPYAAPPYDPGRRPPPPAAPPAAPPVPPGE
jgi:hypothetical protein